jgi:renalase
LVLSDIECQRCFLNSFTKGLVMQRVAVVGAGLAGLTCAQTLKSAGLEVVVIEKSRGVGGRLSTRRAQWAQYDHGAQYFTVRDERFASFVNAGLTNGSVAIWQPRLAKQASDTPSQTWYVGSPGMSALGRAQATGLDVRTEMRVQALVRVDAGWHLAMEDGSHLDGFDAVVVAVPNEQAVPLLEPHVPSWSQQLERTPMQPCWTLMVSTAESLTDLDATLPAQAQGQKQGAQGVRGVRGVIGWWARNSSKPGRPTAPGRHDWVIQATAQWSQANVETAKSDVEQELLQAFAGELGCPEIKPLEPPMVHRWLYARRRQDLAALNEPWWQPQIGLGVCGDGLTQSRVEQAYLSGLRLGQAISDNIS